MPPTSKAKWHNKTQQKRKLARQETQNKNARTLNSTSPTPIASSRATSSTRTSTLPFKLYEPHLRREYSAKQRTRSTRATEILGDLPKIDYKSNKRLNDYGDCTFKELTCLKDDNQLTSSVMNDYIRILRERTETPAGTSKCFIFNTFFYSKYAKEGYENVYRWTKNKEITRKNLLLIPVNESTLYGCPHWCLAVIDLQHKRKYFLDPYCGKSRYNIHTKNIDKYIGHENRRPQLPASYYVQRWKWIMVPHPQQHNSFDCGTFVLSYLRSFVLEHPFEFTQKDMPYIRNYIACELRINQLLD